MGEGGYILRILRYIMILRFRLENIYFNNNEYCCILLNKFSLSSSYGRELNNGRNDLISGL